jgi:hypothetical protein
MRMQSGRNLRIGLLAVVASLAMMSFAQVRAHGGGNWDPFTIDGVNNDARIEVSKVHALMAEVIRGRSGADDWPVDGMQEMRDALLTIKEVVDEVLEHYVIDGVDIQFVATLHDHPRAGRTVAASRALSAGIAIIEHAGSLDNADAFITEFYAGGMAARLFELLEVNTDRMDLYSAMTEIAEQLRVPDSLPE